MSPLQGLGTLVRKDLLLGWRSRARWVSVVLFGVVTLLLFSFAVGPDSTAMASGASGFLILALLLSSTLALSESFRLEHQNRALEGLMMAPVQPTALFFGKAISNTLFLTLLAPVLTPVAVVLFALDADVAAVLSVVGLWTLAAAGLSAPGTMFAAMTSRLRSQDVLLPLLLFPLVVPVLLASVKAADLVLNGDPMQQLGSWTLLLVSFDVVYWSLCGALFSLVAEEGS